MPLLNEESIEPRFIGGSAAGRSRPAALVWIASFLLCACSDAANGLTIQTGAAVDPSDPNRLSEVLVIPGAVRITGAPPDPAPTGTPEAPTVTVVEPEVEIASGDQAVIRLTFYSPTGYRKCFVKVQGADDSFRIDGNDPTTEGELQIPVNVPESVCTGSFSLDVSIAGSSELVSNRLTASVSITSTQNAACGGDTGGAGSGGGTGGAGSGGGGTASCMNACRRIVDAADCYEDGLAGCMEDCGANATACPTQMAAMNACVLDSAPACDDEGRLLIPGCDEEAQAVRDCSGDSAY